MEQQPWEKYAQQPTQGSNPWEKYGAPPAPDGPPDTRNSMQQSFDTETQTNPKEPLLQTGLKSVVGGAGSMFVHPLKSLQGMADLVTNPIETVPKMVDAAKQDYKEGGLPYAAVKQLGNLVGGIGAGAGIGAATGLAGEGASMAREAAMGDPNAAALRGLQIGPKSPKTLSTLKSVEGARPYLKGAQSLEDLQSKISPAKAEIWEPYKKAIDTIGHKTVTGPDGPTTIGELESERSQLSALNRGLKQQLPEAIQLAQQKGMTQAELLAREKAVQGALDPELANTGINPQLIRQTFGNVAQVGKQMSGKSTLIEKPQPSGFGKMTKLSLEHPFQAPEQVLSGVRDLVAGRPWWEAKPTDLGIKEGFRTGGPKPDLGRMNTTGMAAPPRGLLNTPPIQLGGPPVAGGTPAGYRPPPVAADTTAMRLGRLLKAPPIELGGAVEGPKGPTYHYDTSPMRTGKLLNTPPEPPIKLGGKVEGPKGQPFNFDTTPMRMGRILPASVSDEIPLSSHSDIFPEQRSGATMRKPKTIEGKK